jgi:predicted dehydrogenase
MPTTRRRFLTAAALGAGAATELMAEEPQRVSPNDRIRVALIGNGIRGFEDARSSINAGAELAAVSDIYEGRLTRAKEAWGSSIFTTRDYREILARPDVDAVIVATPDHWHRQICVDAMKAGKDVYCEKPMVQLLDDGPEVIETANKTGRVLQVGSQRVSSIVYQKARELLDRGAIGQLNLVEAWIDRNSAIGAWQYSVPPDASPTTIDWDRFLGRAPKHPFDPVRLFRWRNYRDYGTGVGGDLFVHLFSGMHYMLDAIGPTRVFTTGGLRFWKDGRDVPDVMLGLYDYPARGKHPAFNLSLRVDFVNGGGEAYGFKFIGSEGVMMVGSSLTVTRQPREAEPGHTSDTFARGMNEAYLKEYRAKYPVRIPNADSMRPVNEETFHAPRGYDDTFDHHRNFLTAVRTRKAPVEDAVFGFRAAGPALLSNISYFDQRLCLWDPEAMKLKT